MSSSPPLQRSPHSSLVDLSLEDFEFVVGNLVRFLSSACCPRLQKLQLRKLRLLKRDTNLLKVEASTLLELSCEEIESAWGLELKTPSLRVLHLVDRDRHGYLETVSISAPRLEELTFLYDLSMHMFIDGDELPCVRSLKTELQSHMTQHCLMKKESIVITTSILIVFAYSGAVCQSHALEYLLEYQRYASKGHPMMCLAKR